MAISLGEASDDLLVNHDINVTPFIDVMLVLLIIFMVAAPLATVDVKVDLPVSNATPAPKPNQPVYLSIQADGQLSINGKGTSEAELGEMIRAATRSDREQRIFLRADKSVTYERIMAAMNALRSAGYLRVALVGAEGSGR